MKIENRTIKFRVWDKQGKTWIYNNSSDWVGTGIGNIGSADIQPWKCMSLKGEIMSNDNMGGFVDSNQEEYVIQQFTGLKDKNDKDIFEGDIVKIPTSSLFRKDACEVRYIGNRFVPDDMTDSVVEIIGNIFENPELLS